MKAHVLTALAALAFSAGAMAQETPSFDSVDTNQDGMINQEEATSVEGLDFAAADTNHDGLLDLSAYETYLTGKLQDA